MWSKGNKSLLLWDASVLKLSCEDTSDYEMAVFVVSIIFILILFNLIIASYIQISHCSQNEISWGEEWSSTRALSPDCGESLSGASIGVHDTWLLPHPSIGSRSFCVLHYTYSHAEPHYIQPEEQGGLGPWERSWGRSWYQSNLRNIITINLVSIWKSKFWVCFFFPLHRIPI